MPEIYKKTFYINRLIPPLGHITETYNVIILASARKRIYIFSKAPGISLIIVERKFNWEIYISQKCTFYLQYVGNVDTY